MVYHVFICTIILLRALGIIGVGWGALITRPQLPAMIYIEIIDVIFYIYLINANHNESDVICRSNNCR